MSANSCSSSELPPTYVEGFHDLAAVRRMTYKSVVCSIRPAQSLFQIVPPPPLTPDLNASSHFVSGHSVARG